MGTFFSTILVDKLACLKWQYAMKYFLSCVRDSNIFSCRNFQHFTALVICFVTDSPSWKCQIEIFLCFQNWNDPLNTTEIVKLVKYKQKVPNESMARRKWIKTVNPKEQKKKLSTSSANVHSKRTWSSSPLSSFTCTLSTTFFEMSGAKIVEFDNAWQNDWSNCLPSTKLVVSKNTCGGLDVDLRGWIIPKHVPMNCASFEETDWRYEINTSKRVSLPTSCGFQSESQKKNTKRESECFVL